MMQASLHGKLYSIVTTKHENRGVSLLKSKDFDFRGRNQELHFMNNHQTHDQFGFISHQSKHKMMIIPVMSSSSSLSSELQAEFEAADQSKTVHVKLQLQKECLFGENILVVGDDPIFGMWDPVNAVPLEWSEDHLWRVELEIPVGRTILFKFLLIGNSGNILWQPGPNRVMSTWETKNVITVLEDWENAEFLKITEEEPIRINNNEIPLEKTSEMKDNETMSLVAENITYPEEKHVKADEEEPFRTSNNEISMEKTSEMKDNETKSMVAENITYLKEKHVKADKVKVELEISRTQESSENAEIKVELEESPVLVPGLIPLDDRSIIMDSMARTDETENKNASEASSESDVQQSPVFTRVKEQWQSNMNWGRKALQQVLSNLGFDIQKET